jgi:glycosyltransferase involved in cell wall biosynthesis
MGRNPNGSSIHESYKAQLKESRLFSEIPSLEYLENAEYDTLLQKSVVFLDLIDSSANNAILECLARGTPLLVNRLPAVEEYLGQNYPLFYNYLDEAAEKLKNIDLLKDASTYLLRSPIRRTLTYECFVETLTGSKIYQNLN